MRVLQVVADGNPGGGTTHALKILARLNREYALGLITQRGSYLMSEATRLGIESFGVEFFRSRFDPEVPIRIRKIAREIRPDFIHTHGGRSAFFCSLSGIQAPMVYTVHAYHFVHRNFVFRSAAIRAKNKIPMDEMVRM